MSLAHLVTQCMKIESFVTFVLAKVIPRAALLPVSTLRYPLTMVKVFVGFVCEGSSAISSGDLRWRYWQIELVKLICFNQGQLVVCRWDLQVYKRFSLVYDVVCPCPMWAHREQRLEALSSPDCREVAHTQQLCERLYTRRGTSDIGLEGSFVQCNDSYVLVGPKSRVV